MTAAPVVERITLLDHALNYAARGIPVFPLRPGSKIPLPGSNGFYDATTDEEQVRAWWADNPDANIGVPTGILWDAIDVDGLEGCRSIDEWEKANGSIPKGPTVFTPSGGYHALGQPTGFGNRAGMLPHVDHRGKGGYTVVPPSVVPDGTYEWDPSPFDVEVPAFTEEVVELIADRRREPIQKPPMRDRLQARQAFDRPSGGGYGEAALQREVENVLRATEGTRNDTLHRSAFNLYQLADDGELDRTEVTERLASAARQIGLGGLEIERTLASAERGARENPRSPDRRPDKEARAPSHRATTEQSADDDDWPEPSPLEAVSTLPDFPLHALPQWMGSYVAGISEEKQVAPDLAGLLGLAVLAATTGGHVFAEVRQGWGSEPTNLYALVALPSGERKSPVVAELTIPLSELEAEMQADGRDARARAEADAKLARREADEAERDAAKGGSISERTTNVGLMREAAAKAAEAADAIPPIPRLLVGDITPEKLAAMLAEQKGRLALISAEGGVFESIAGRYDSSRGKGPAKASLDIWLQAHSGERVTVDRKGDAAPIVVDSACLTIAIAVQPAVLDGLAHVPGFTSRGLLGRFLMAIPKSSLGSRNLTPTPCDNRLKEAWSERILELGRAVRKRHGKITLTFAPEADRRLVSFARELEPKLAAGSDYTVMVPWAAKLAGQVARIATLLYLAETGPEGLDGQVDEASVERAIAIGEYLIPHALAAHDRMGADPEMSKAKEALALIRSRGWEEVAPRDLQRASRATFPTADEAKRALTVLADHDLVREAAEQSRGGLWAVNPAALSPQSPQSQGSVE